MHELYTPVHTHITHTHTHTHTQTGLVPLAVTLGSYFSHCIHKARTCARTHLHCYVNSPYTIFVTNITHKHTHTHTHTHRAGLVPLAETLGSYFSHCFHKSYMCMNVHICAHTHAYAHTHTQTGLVPLAVTLGSYFSHCLYKAYMNVHICTHTCIHTHTHTHRDWACTTCRVFTKCTCA